MTTRKINTTKWIRLARSRQYQKNIHSLTHRRYLTILFATTNGNRIKTTTKILGKLNISRERNFSKYLKTAYTIDDAWKMMKMFQRWPVFCGYLHILFGVFWRLCFLFPSFVPQNIQLALNKLILSINYFHSSNIW